MKRIRNGIKALIVVICVAVVAVGVVIGVVLANKEQTSKIDKSLGFTAAQQLLADEINANAEAKATTYEIISTIPYDGICTIDQITDYADNYFVYEDEDGDSHFVIYQTNEEGEVEIKDLTDSNLGFVFGNYMIAETEGIDNYAVFAYDKENSGYYTISIVYFGDFETPVEVFNVTSTDEEYIDFSGDEIFYIKEKYCILITQNLNTSEYNLICYYFDEKNLTLNDFLCSFNFSSLDFTSTFNDDYFLILDENNYYHLITMYENDTIEIVFSIDQENSFYQMYKINESTFILEYRNKVENPSKYSIYDENSNYYYNNKYEILTIGLDGSFSIKEFVLNEGYSKLYLGNTYLTTSYYLCEQKVDENYILSNEYLFTYYDNLGNKIVSYEATELSSCIYYAGSSTFLIGEKIVSVYHDYEVKTKIDLVSGDEYSLSSVNLINSGYSNIVNEDGNYGLMNANGEIVIDPSEFNFYVYSIFDNTAFGVNTESVYNSDINEYEDVETCYIINLTTNEKQSLDLADNENFLKLFIVGVDCYLIYDDENEYYCFYDHNCVSLINIVNFNYYKNISSGSIIEIVDDSNKKLSIKFNKSVSFTQSLNENQSYSSFASGNISYEVIDLLVDAESDEETIDTYSSCEKYSSSKWTLNGSDYNLRFCTGSYGSYFTCICFWINYNKSGNTDQDYKFYIYNLSANTGSVSSDYFLTNGDGSHGFYSSHDNLQRVYVSYEDGYYYVYANIESNDFSNYGFITSSHKFENGSTYTSSYSNITYKISYDLDGGSYGDNHPTSATYTASITISNPTKVGYTFQGWTITNLGGYGTQYIGSSSNTTTSTSASSVKGTSFKNLTTEYNSTVEFTAVWKVNTYTISFVYNSDLTSDTSKSDISYSDWVNVSSYVPERTGYTFSGWTISGMTTGHYKNYGTSESSFSSGYYSYSEATIYITTKNYIYFRYLCKTNGGTVTFTAVWSGNSYYIKFYAANNDIPGYYGIDSNLVTSNIFDYDSNSNGSYWTQITTTTGNVFSTTTYTGTNIIIGSNGKNLAVISTNYDDYSSTNGIGFTVGATATYGSSGTSIVINEGTDLLTYIFYSCSGSVASSSSAWKQLLPGNSSNLSVKDSSYQLSGWYLRYNGKLYRQDCGTTIYLSDYITNGYGGTSLDKTDDLAIQIYAEYTEMSFYVSLVAESTYGAAASNGTTVTSFDLSQPATIYEDSVQALYNVEAYYVTASTETKFDNNGSYSSTSISNWATSSGGTYSGGYDVKSGRTLRLYIGLNDTNSTSLYDLSRIVITNVGYLDNTTYKYATIIMIRTGSTWDIKYYTQASYITEAPDMSNLSTSGNLSDGSIGGSGYNTVSITANTDKTGCSYLLQISKVYYGNNGEESSAPTSDGINGFTVYLFAEANQQSNPNVDVSSSSTLYTYETDGTEGTGTYYAQPVVGNSIWVEGYKYELDISTSSTSSGYATATNAYNDEDKIWVYVVYNSSSGTSTNFVAYYQASKIVIQSGSNNYIWVGSYKYSLDGVSTSGAKRTATGVTNSYSFDVYVAYDSNAGSYIAYYPKENNSTAGADINIDNSTDSTPTDAILSYNLKYNTGNSTIITIAPQQTLYYITVSPESSMQSAYYELDSYLSTVTINGTGYNLSLSKTYGQTGGYSFSSSDTTGVVITDISIKTTENNITTTSYPTFEWLGDTYSIELLAVINTNFYLFFGYRTTDNYCMYFLFSNDLKTALTSVGFKFTSYDDNGSGTLKVTTTVENIDETAQTATATVAYAQNSNTGATAVSYTSTTTGSSVTANVTPSDATLIKITPSSDFLIYSITLTYGTTSYISLTLSNLTLNRSSTTSTYSYASDSGMTIYYGGTSRSVAMNDYSYPNYTSSNRAQYSGIYLGYYNSTNAWFTDDLSSDSYRAFESIYIWVCGIYENVSIKVQTISYFEFDFENASGLVTLNNANTITSLNLSIWDYTESMNFLETNSSSTSYVNGINSGYYGEQNNQTLYSVRNTLNDFNSSYYSSGVYSYPIFVSYYNNTTSSDYNFLRVIFLGKYQSIKQGLKFSATTTSKSYVFSNIGIYDYSYRSQSTSAISRVITTLANYADVSGRQNSGNDLATSTSGNVTTTTIYSTDILTYVYLWGTGKSSTHSISDIFNHTYSSETKTYTNMTTYETYPKRVMVFDVDENNVDLTISSFIYNKNLESVEFDEESYLYSSTGSESYNLYIDDSYNLSTLTSNDLIVAGIKVIGESSTSSSNKLYQLDYVGSSYSKTGSWFNDTILTNIAIEVGDTNTNWQNLSTSEISFSGSTFTFVYYETAGYYLDYIVIKFSDKYYYLDGLSELYMHKDENSTGYTENTSLKKGTITVSGLASSGTKLNITYTVIYDKNAGTLTITFSADDIETATALLSNDVKIAFLSMAYSFDVEFSVNSGNSSSNGLESTKTSASYQTIYYDSLTSIAATATMEGYTFVGWGSKYYFDLSSGYGTDLEINRYDSTTNTWSTVSSWIEMSSYFGVDYRNSLLGLKSTTASTYNGQSGIEYSSAFYTSGGYIITDTGNTGTTSTQNYNFWSAYANVFVSTIGAYNSGGKIVGYSSALTLYAIWKANVYIVTLDFNDVNSDNGSTTAQISLLNKILGSSSQSTYSSYASNRNGFLSGSSSIYSSLSYDSSVFYIYITFDTSNWYIVDANYSTKYLNSQYLAYLEGKVSLYSSSAYAFLIERYGYTWLGWFAEKIDNAYQGETLTNSHSSSLILSSEYYSQQTGAGIILPTLNYTLFSIFERSELLSDSVSPKFVYYNQDVVDMSISSYYTCFYIYGCYYDGTKLTTSAYVTQDFNNRYASDYLNNLYYAASTDGSNSNSIYKYYSSERAYLSYFDTSLDYSAYSVSNSTLSVSRWGNTRSVTLVAYWQTNLYTSVVSYTDYDVYKNGYTKYSVGSTSVSDGKFTKTFEVYFDDQSANFTYTGDASNPYKTLAEQLATAVPYRIGYDFVGWSFYYYTTDGTENSAYGNTYELNQTLLITYVASDGDYIIPTRTAGGESIYSSGNLEAIDSTASLYYFYVYAIWEAQTFTANLDLNITTESLENLYGSDSDYVVAIYDSSTYTSYKTAVTPNNTYLPGASATSNPYGDIISNIYIVFTFDDAIANAYFVINGTTYSATTYPLKDLFAISTGYYFLGWLYRESLYSESGESNYLIQNTLKTVLAESINFQNGIVNKNNTVSASESPSYSVTTFDKSFYENIYVSYLQTSNNKALPVSSDEEKVDENNNTATESSNYGYITIDGTNYYIHYDKSYNDNAGGLYIWQDGYKVYLTISTSSISYDESFLYYNVSGNVCTITVDSNGNAYYVSNSVKFSVGDITVLIGSGSSTKSYTLKVSPTRLFTLYAHWAKKTDYKITISDGNSSGNDGSSNTGLGGYYYVYYVSGDESYGTNTVDLTYSYKQTLAGYIIPAYNGRYLTQMTISFDRIESPDNENNTSYYKLTRYTLTIDFEWDGENQIYYITTNGITLSYSTASGSTSSYYISHSDSNYYYTLTDSSSGEILTLLSSSLTGIFSIYSYGNYSDQSEPSVTRTDINKLYFNFSEVASNIDITCYFSVQTFEVDFYYILDENGNELTISDSSSYYSTPYTTVDSDSNYFKTIVENNTNTQSPIISSNYRGEYLATISNDVYTSKASYNVPYGYFIYGNTTVSADSLSTNILEKSELYGYAYIYDKNYYKLNSSDNTLATQYASVLGTSSNSTTAFKLTFNYYTFSGWYEAEVDPYDSLSIVFYEYNETKESTAINRNITLYAYYYSVYEPKSVQFYEWSDDLRKYVEYTENQDDYILSSITSYSAYEVQNGVLVVNEDSTSDKFDTDNIAILNETIEINVDQDSFNNRYYSTSQTATFYTSFDANGDTIKENPYYITSNTSTLETVAQTFWFYSHTYTVFKYGETYIQYLANTSTPEKCFTIDGTTFCYIVVDTSTETTTYYLNFTVTNEETNEITEYNYELEMETKTYYYYTGADLYMQIGSKYYKFYEYTVSESDSAWLKYYKPAYYVNYLGNTYYLYPEIGGKYFPSSTLFDKNGTNDALGISYSIVSLKNYEVYYNDTYYPVVYQQSYDIIDEIEYTSSVYINPYNADLRGKVTIIDDKGTYIYYLNYENAQLYTLADLSELVSTSTFNYEMFSAYNDNYSVGIYYNDSTSGSYRMSITLKSLPSAQISTYFDGIKYDFVGYIEITDSIVSALKQQTYDETTIQTNTTNITSFTAVTGYDGWYQISYNSGTYYVYKDSSSLFSYYGNLEDNIYSTNSVTFTYSGGTTLSSITVSEQVITTTSKNQVIYDKLLSYYISKGYIENTDEDIAIFKSATQSVFDSISLSDLLSWFIVAYSYVYDEDGSTSQILTNFYVTLTIPSFTNSNDDPIESLQVTLPVQYTFNLLTTGTRISTNVYAIPIYAPQTLQFTTSSILSYSSGTLNIDTTEMRAWFFQNGEVYSTDRVNNNVSVGDYLQYAIISEEYYKTLISETYVCDYLTFLIDNDEVTVVSSKGNLESLSLAVGDGYYVIAFYYDHDYYYASTQIKKVITISDNVIKVSDGTATIVDFGTV